MTLIDNVRKYATNEFKFLVWKVNRRIRNTVTVHTKQGLLTVFASDPEIGRELICNGAYEFDLTLRVQRFLQNHDRVSGGTILDIGANMGVISIGMIYNHFAERAIAIEPDPHNFALLKHNVEQNGMSDKIICVRMAVSDVKNKLDFELSHDNFGDRRIRTKTNESYPELYGESSRQVIEVEADCLDNILQTLPNAYTDDIRLIWLDTQGHEGKIFLGGKQTFSRDIPVISELWPYGIARTGMNDELFCDIAKELWSSYWVTRRGKFFRYPISMLNLFIEELGHGYDYESVIFTKF